MLPIKEFKKGKILYKGSSSFRGDVIMEYHMKILQSSRNLCDQRTSIYLGPNKNRSKEYFRPKLNHWNEFKLKKDMKV